MTRTVMKEPSMARMGDMVHPGEAEVPITRRGEMTIMREGGGTRPHKTKRNRPEEPDITSHLDEPALHQDPDLAVVRKANDTKHGRSGREGNVLHAAPNPPHKSTNH